MKCFIWHAKLSAYLRFVKNLRELKIVLVMLLFNNLKGVFVEAAWSDAFCNSVASLTLQTTALYKKKKIGLVSDYSTQ